MFLPVFTLNLNQKILPGRVTIGEYDGEHPCLTAATIGDKVFIHNPHQRVLDAAAAGRMEATQKSQDIALLNIHQRVKAIAAGKLDPRSPNDSLLVGTATNLLAYDVERNADLFHKDVPDGVNAVTVGKLGALNGDSVPLAIVGGNCSLQGFDYEGNDPFWTVTGDNVTSLCLMDYNGDGKNELIVGSEDFEIRIFAEDEILSEITETEALTALTPVEGSRFGYSLTNGTVGVYEKTTRWWRIKSKNSATSIFSFDLDGDGVNELITGWSNGKLDARNDRSGEVIFKDNFNTPIAGLSKGEYRMDGKLNLVACATEGEVRGYLPSNPESRERLYDFGAEQEMVRDLTQKKQNLLLELKNYSENLKKSHELAISGVSISSLARETNQSMGVIPAQTHLSIALGINLTMVGDGPHVEVTLSTSNDTLIRCVLIFAEGIFAQECHVVHPREGMQTVQVPIYPARDIAVDLHIKAFVGYANSSQYHVFELTRQLPRFAMYLRLPEGHSLSSMATMNTQGGSPPPPEEVGDRNLPRSRVTFKLNERIARVAMWINQNFLVGEEELSPKETKLRIVFASLRHPYHELHFSMESDGNIEIRCDDIDLCGDIIQALAVDYLGLDYLNSFCDFPTELTLLESLLTTVNNLQSVRQRLSAEMADHSGLIRSLIVRAEDSRLMVDTKNMRKWYSQLYDINRDLIYGYKIRVTNHKELLDTLKQVNQIIQMSARLRVGKAKAKVISESRAAMKQNNSNLLLKVIRNGDSV